jgi:phage gp46-like protein
MIDYSIRRTMGGDVVSFDATDSLYNNVFFSLRIKRGCWVEDGSFGSRLHTIKKLTDDTIALAADYCREALQWLVDLERVVTVNVVCARDGSVDDRLNIAVTIIKDDRAPVVFNLFYTVG